MKFFLLLITALIVENTILAQPGTLDNTFNDSGKVLNYDFGVVRATAIQPDGKILVGGEIFTTELHAFTIVRYLPDGTVDESFGDNGKVQTAIAGGGVGIYNLSVLKSGKILAAGYGLVFFQFPIYQSPILAQYLPDGSPDPSFGDNGVVTINTRSIGTVTTRGMAVMEDGRIVQAGSNSQQNTTVLRYMPDGSLDKTFGADGISNVYLSGIDNINCLVLQPDGKIMVGGSYDINSSSANFLIARFNTDGTLDSSFGYNGKRIIDYNSSTDIIYSLALQPDGKILAAGSVAPAGITTSTMCMVRFNPNGFYDSSFGSNGIALATIDNYYTSAAGVVLQSDGKITACGRAVTASDDVPGKLLFLVAQFKADGSLNTTFGDGGKTLTDFGLYQRANALSLQADGKIVVAGNGIPGDDSEPYYNLALARYNNGQSSLIARIKKWIKNHHLYWQDIADSSIAYYSIGQSNNATRGFTEIAKVSPTEKNLYSYALPAMAANAQPANYYRINAVDAGNNVVASAVINNVDAAMAAINTLSIYPNPVKNTLYIKGLETALNYKLSVANTQGNIVATTAITNTTAYSFNVAGLNKGVYYATVSTAGRQIFSTKFIKE